MKPSPKRVARAEERPEDRKTRSRWRAVAAEVAIVVALGTVLGGFSVALLVTRYPGTPRFTVTDLLTIAGAALVAATIVRLCVRLHRGWARTLGRTTSAAALCALSGVVGSVVVLVPDRCPGTLFATGRCDVQETTAWGLAVGLAAVVNFAAAGLAVGLYRGVRGVLGDTGAVGLDAVRALSGLRRRSRSAHSIRTWGKGRRQDPHGPKRPRDPREPKGRPTPRRADAQRARRGRPRSRA
jgi:hypothetical protein